MIEDDVNKVIKLPVLTEDENSYMTVFTLTEAELNPNKARHSIIVSV